MSYWVYVNSKTRTAKAHVPTCPIPERRKLESNKNGYWREFDSAQNSETAERDTGHRFWWCLCISCKRKSE